MTHAFENYAPASAEVRNEWSYTSTSPILLHGLYRITLLLLHHTATKNNCISDLF